MRPKGRGCSWLVCAVRKWRQVRHMLASLDPEKPSHARAKAILLLASIYGLRCSEIVRLTLDDLNWCDSVITIRRSKRGRVQQFPLQHEVGEAIIRYLRDVRPPSRSRAVFLTSHYEAGWSVVAYQRRRYGRR